MSSTRHARVIAGLGVAGLLAGSGFALSVAPASAATATPVTTTYACTLAPGEVFDIPTTLSLPPIGGDYVVGQTIPQLPISDGTLTIPSSLEQAVVALAPLAQSLGVDLSSASLGGTIVGQSTVGSQQVPTSVTVPSTPLSGLLSVTDPSTLPDLPINGLTGTVGGSKGTVLTSAGDLPVSLPTTITADLIPALDPLLSGKPTCTAPKQAVGHVTVAKAKSKFSSARLVASKVSAAKRAAVKAALVNSSVAGSSVKPDGTVTAYVGKKKVGSGKLKKGATTFSLSKLKKGVYHITVEYAGSKNFKAAASKKLKLTVTK